MKTPPSSIEIADIFNEYGYLLSGLSTEQYKVVQAIKNCRTSFLGGHKLKCNDCNYQKNAYNSCRNRHCPKCGFTARTQWIEKRSEELLPCPYFHVVFTVPSELRPLILRNKKICYNLLIKASSETLKEVASSKQQMGVEIGCIGVLHTWSQSLIDHPHVHFIVPGGGLNKKQTKWVSASQDYLLPVKVLSKVFRGKMLELLEQAFDKNELEFKGQVEHLSHPGLFRDLLFKCSQKGFNVDARKPFAGPEQVIKYLGGYTHRIAISNYRLVKIENESVYFKVRDSNNPGKSKIMSLHVKEFMRRFLLHVLPKAFVRIRHFGILGNRYKKLKISIIRKLQNIKEKAISHIKNDWKSLLQKHSEIDADQCPRCKKGLLSRIRIFFPKYSSA